MAVKGTPVRRKTDPQSDRVRSRRCLGCGWTYPDWVPFVVGFDSVCGICIAEHLLPGIEVRSVLLRAKELAEDYRFEHPRSVPRRPAATVEL